MGFIFFMTACVPISPIPPWPTNTPLPSTKTPTPTVIWFPLTATHTPFPTQVVSTPTMDLRPGTGKILFTDDFSDASGWTLITTAAGSVALGKNELSIVINQPKAYIYSVREEPIFIDFYIEITANPSLCRGMDEYGLLLRVTPNLDYYRFGLSCDGEARLDRIYGNQATSPQIWMPSSAIPPGAPSTSRLSVWVVGDDLRFFVNNEYLFTVRDPLITSGSVGLYARSSGDMPITINFSDLVVREVVR